MNLRIKNTSITTKILGWLQIIGGIYGLGVVSFLTINLGEISGALLFIILVGYLLFTLSITAGVKLLSKRTVKLGLILSVVNNCLQLFQFKVLGWALTFTSGMALAFGYNEGFKFEFAIISSEFNMAINTDDMEFYFLINVMAFVFIAVLLDIWRELFGEEVREGVTRESKSNEG